MKYMSFLLIGLLGISALALAGVGKLAEAKGEEITPVQDDIDVGTIIDSDSLVVLD